MINKLPPVDKTLKKVMLQLETHVLAEYRRLEHKQNIKTQEKQLQLIKRIVTEYFRVGKNKENQCKNILNKQASIDFLRIQQNYLDQSETINRMKKQMQIQFDMTKEFIKNFKREGEAPRIHLQNINLTQSITNYRKENEFKLDLFKVKEISEDRVMRKGCTTERIRNTQTQFNEEDDAAQPVGDKNVTLQRLKKLQRFLYEKEGGNNLLSRTTKPWTFSPPKAYYKQENQTLKILQENLRTQLQSLEHDRHLNLNEAIIKRQEHLKTRQNKLNVLEQQLFKKEMNLNKRHADILRKEQLLKRVQ